MRYATLGKVDVAYGLAAPMWLIRVRRFRSGTRSVTTRAGRLYLMCVYIG